VTTLVIDRETLPETVSSLFRSPRITIQQRQSGGEVVMSPVINPDDYPNDTEYLKAIPGMMESIFESINAPKSERVTRKELWGDV